MTNIVKPLDWLKFRVLEHEQVGVLMVMCMGQPPMYLFPIKSKPPNVRIRREAIFKKKTTEMKPNSEVIRNVLESAHSSCNVLGRNRDMGGIIRSEAK